MTIKRMRLLTLVALGAAVATATAPSSAHHAFAAEFDSNQPVDLRGAVTRLQWTNPHSWLYIEVTAADGASETWAVEFGAPYSLLRRGLRRTDFPLGTEVVVKGFRAKNGKPVANASSVTFPDGRSYYTAAADSPDAARQGGGLE